MEPRKVGEQRKATDPIFARLAAMEANSFESIVFFLPAVLACIQMGVDKAAITDYAGFYCLARAAFLFFYLTSFGTIKVPFSVLRTFAWAASTMAWATLFLLAAEASSAN